MRQLTQFEQNHVNGGEVSFVIPVDPNQELNFTVGFNAGLDLVGGTVGFLIAIPAALVILPCRAIYTVASSAYTTISDKF